MTGSAISSAFWSKVYIPAKNACWIWQGSKRGPGYGVLSVNGRSVGAHRVAVMLHGEVIPKGMHIDHLCRNPSCVNPGHLEVVTPKENTLRGVGPTAINAKKDQCSRGHGLTPENTLARINGWRGCKLCKKIAMRNARAKIRATAEPSQEASNAAE